ncbi:phage baseplate assembly protein [Citrobacter braakii]|uniref:phage baseplate assembly protein n=1 Tax=Citrobacter braakii TaxID=57706 RepID=UPI00403914A1
MNNTALRNTRALENNVVMRCAGRVFSGWLSVQITRSIENVAGQCSFGVAIAADAVMAIDAGDKAVELDINGVRVLTGYLDELTADVSGDAFTLTLTGRDKTGDLVDCAAVWPGGQWSGRSLEQIARDLCTPFGIAVRWEVTEPAAAQAFGSFKLEHSETVYEALGRAARMRGVLMTSTANGELLFTQAGTASAGKLELGKTLLAIQYTKSWQDRFSLYRVVGGHAHGGNIGNELTDVAQITGPTAAVTDPDVTRWRPTLKVADHNITQQTAWARADHERRQAIAKGTRFAATVAGWYRPSGALWEVNQLVSVTAAVLQLHDVSLLIVSAEFGLDDSDGLVTHLTLAPRDGFIVPVESENKGGSGGYTDAEKQLIG